MLSPLPFLLLGLPFVASTPIESRASSSTQNGITDGSGCKPMMVVFARGTTEGGNVGSVVGPPFSDALSSAMGAGNVAFQGVDYPASIPGFLAGGDANGSKSMAQTVTQTIQKCPNSSVVMSGYSQGGQLVHNAAKQMDPATAAKVSSAIIFGDPMNGTAVAGVSAAKTKVICHAGDNICMGGDTILQAHLTYGQNAGEAASFATAAAKK